MPRNGLSIEQLRELARDGADAALRRLRAEIIAIERTFPELALTDPAELCVSLSPPLASGPSECQRPRGRQTRLLHPLSTWRPLITKTSFLTRSR